jgi:hypothetical protein
MNKTGIFTLLVFTVLLSIIFFVIPQLESYDISEGIRGGRGGRGWRRRGGGGGRIYRGRGGRRWYGGNIGYSYRPPLAAYGPRYIPWWTPAYWFTGKCKDGCTNIGNNNWGCQYPGYGYNDCMFARDCMGCGNKTSYFNYL